jgi:hypothetical protein
MTLPSTSIFHSFAVEMVVNDSSWLDLTIQCQGNDVTSECDCRDDTVHFLGMKCDDLRPEGRCHTLQLLAPSEWREAAVWSSVSKVLHYRSYLCKMVDETTYFIFAQGAFLPWVMGNCDGKLLCVVIFGMLSA